MRRPRRGTHCLSSRQRTAARRYLRVQGVANISEFVRQVSRLFTVDRAATTWEPNTGNGARARASVSRHNTHSTCATMRRVVSASCAYTPLVSLLQPSLFLFLETASSRGSLECVTRMSLQRSRIERTPRTGSRYTRSPPTEGNFSEKSIDRTLENVYVSLFLSFLLSLERDLKSPRDLPRV